MRLISSDNTVDVNYEDSTLIVTEDGVIKAVTNTGAEYELCHCETKEAAANTLMAVRAAKGKGRNFFKVGKNPSSFSPKNR